MSPKRQNMDMHTPSMESSSGYHKNWIVILPLIVFILLFVHNYYNWNKAEKRNSLLIKNQSLNAAEDILLRIDAYLRERTNDLEILADSIRLLDGEDRKTHFLRNANQTILRERSFYSICFVDVNHSVQWIAHNSPEFDEKEKDRYSFLSQLPHDNETRAPVISPLMTLPSGISVLELFLPVWADNSEIRSFQGYVSGLIQTDILSYRIIASSLRSVCHVFIEQGGAGIIDTNASPRESDANLAQNAQFLFRNILNQEWKVSVYPHPDSDLANLSLSNLRQFRLNATFSLFISLLLALILIMVLRVRKSENQLRLSENQFRAMAENARNFVIYRAEIDPQEPMHARIVFVSPSVRDILGIENEKRLLSWFETIHEDDLDTVLNEYFRSIATGSPFEQTMRIYNARHKEWRWIEVKANPVGDEEGKPIYFNGMIIDITSVKQSGEKLEKSERLYRNTIELINAVPYFLNYQTNQYEYVGEGITKLLGVSPEEFTHDIWNSMIVERELLGNLQNLSLDDALQKARGQEAVDWQAVYRVETRTGEKRWIANAAVQVRDDKGVVTGSLGILQDITEHKRTEQALLDNERKYRELVQNANSIILRMDPKGTITFFNEFAQHLFGYTEEEIIGQNVVDTIVPKTPVSREKMAHWIRKFCKSPHSYKTGEGKNVCRNGDLISVVWTNKPIYDSQHNLVEILSIGNDVTELKKLQEQFRQAHKMEAIGQLAGGVAHDFNNLLMAILGFSNLALRSDLLDQSLRKNLEEINHAGERAAALTRQLLAFSRKQVLQPSILNLNLLILNMDKMLRRLIGEDIELVTLPDEPLGQIKADPGQLEQIVMNLVVNARDAMPKGGKLTIETANVVLDETYTRKHVDVKEGPHILLSISDSGDGIPRENLDRIFDPFFTTKKEGTGLGLSTVYGIVKQSGGHITAYSELQHGTVFKIYFPRVDEATPKLPRKLPGIIKPGESKTILLAEDEDTVRSLVSRVLRRHGYTVLEAGYGSQAIEVSQHHKDTIHLLVTDVVMPKMSGRELAKALSKERPDMQVLYMSGYTDNSIVQHGILEEGIEFIQKPFTPDNLIQRIHEMLNTDKPSGS